MTEDLLPKQKQRIMTVCCVAVNFGNIRTGCLSYCPSYQWCPCVYNVTHLTANTLCLIPLTWYCRSSGNPFNRHSNSCYLWLQTRHMTRYMTFLRLDIFVFFLLHILRSFKHFWTVYNNDNLTNSVPKCDVIIIFVIWILAYHLKVMILNLLDDMATHFIVEWQLRM